MVTLLLLSVAGAVLAAVVGTLWYSPGTPMGKIHMQFLGFDKLSDEEKAQKIKEGMKTMPKIYTAQLILSFLTAVAVVFVIITSVKNGVTLGMATLFPVMSWLCFTVPAIGTGILWSNCDKSIAWKKFFSDTLSVLVTILLTVLVVSFFL